MKKFILISVLLCAASFIAGADDIITKLNGEQIKAKVLEVADNSVKFKRLDNPNGPVYVLSFSEIQAIKYENGVVETYNEPAPEEQHYVRDSYDVRYRDIASVYNPSAYNEQFDDPYNPAISGIASFFIPGLGQCIDGEWGRGAGIFAANLGLGVLEATELSIMLHSAVQGSSYYKQYRQTSVSSDAAIGASLCALIITSSAHLVLNIWNICDAVNIAKVKNMYYQDLHVAPQLSFTPSVSYGLQPTAGLSLTLSF